MLPQKTILIVEDEWLIGETLKGDLEQRGHSVLGPAMSCRDAIAILSDRKLDLVLLDTQLQDGSCEPVFTKCQELGVAVVMFSGHPDENLPAFARGLKLLAKPYSESDIDRLNLENAS